MVNGLYNNYFQIFNDDNYIIDLFAKFLRKIVLEINESILMNNFENDFMKRHLIKLNTKKFIILLVKLFNTGKDESNKEKNEYIIKNALIKIRMHQEKNEKKSPKRIVIKIQMKKVILFLKNIQKSLKINLKI